MADLLTSPTDTTGGPPVPPRTLDPYKDTEAILAKMRSKRMQWQKGREAMLGNAYMNLLYERGEHWVVFDVRQNRVRMMQVRPGTPKSVTNRFSSTMRAYASVLGRIEPTLTYAPATDDPEDRATADVASRCMEVIGAECNIRMARQRLAVTSAYTSTGWIELGYDPDPRWGQRLIPHDECLNCGAIQPPDPSGCAACGSRLQVPAKGPDGQPIGTQVAIGKMTMTVRSVFEVFYDLSVTDWTEQRECLTETSLSLDVAKRRFPDRKDEIVADSTPGPGDYYQDVLQTLAGARNEVGRGVMSLPFGRTTVGPGDRVIETRYWELPSEEFPEGLMAIKVGQNILASAGPLPYKRRGADGIETPFLPLVEFPQLLMPGSSFSKTPADDLRAKQAQRNRLESQAELIMQRTGSPTWLTPNGIVIDEITGIAGQVIRYNALGPTPAKPERIPGQGLPSGYRDMMLQIDRDFEELAATFDIIKGTRPAGVSAGVALQMLDERSRSRFASLFILWELGWVRVAEMAVEIFRQFATEPRMLRIKGKNGSWEISKFLGSDLAGRLDITAEAGSAIPQSTLAQRAEMEQMANLGLVDLKDPETRLKALELYGHKDWVPSFAADAKAAIMENEAFAQLAQNPQAAQAVAGLLQQADLMQQQTGQPVPYPMIVQQAKAMGLVLPRVRPVVDGHETHIIEHSDEAKGESSTKWPEPIQLLLELHLGEHQRIYRENMHAPPPKVNVALKGDLAPALAAQLAGGGQPGAPPAAQTGSSLLHAPTTVHHHGPTHITGGAESANQTGQVREMTAAG